MLANLLSYYMVHRWYTNYSIELNSQVNFLLVPLKGNLTSITALQNTMWQNQSFCSVFVLGKFLQFDMLIMKNLLQPFHSFVTENWKIKNLSNHIKSQNWAIFSYFDIMCSFMRTFFSSSRMCLTSVSVTIDGGKKSWDISQSQVFWHFFKKCTLFLNSR